MNKSRIIATFVSGVTLFAVSAFAQTSGSSTGSSSGSTSGSTNRQSPSTTSGTSGSSTSGTSSMNSSTTGSTGSSAYNADSSADSASRFKSLDTDGDGRISRAEFMAGASTSTDTTATSTSSTDSSSGKGEKKHWWSRRSSDKDDTDPSETFAKLDKDNDGFLSQSELAKDHGKHNK
jgi:hypothetical protein